MSGEGGGGGSGGCASVSGDEGRGCGALFG